MRFFPFGNRKKSPASESESQPAAAPLPEGAAPVTPAAPEAASPPASIPAQSPAPAQPDPLADYPLFASARDDQRDGAAAPAPVASDALAASASSPISDAPSDVKADASDPRPRRSFFPRWPTRAKKLATPDESARRALVVGRVMIGLVTLGFLGLLWRVYTLQTKPPPRIQALVGSQKSQIKFLGRPGNLEDRKGRLLATSRAAMQLFVDPGLIEDPSTFAEHVAADLGYDSAFIDERVGKNSDRRYVLLDRRVDDTRAAKIQQVTLLKGLGTDSRLVRDYPQGALGGQIVGFRNIDGHGIEGVEKAFDRELAGKPGSMTFFRDARHHALWIENGQYQPPVDGRSVRLSVDMTIQSFAESELLKACKEFEAQSGEMVAMDPVTGEILAIANYPQVDPNDFGITKPEKRRNRAITDTYEPGSTFKPFIWSMATQGKFASPNEYLDCTSSGVYVTQAGRRLHDAHPAGRVTWDEVLVKSSNIGMAIVGQRMGANNLYEAARAFGFGTPTGTELPGEITGKLRNSKYWTSYSVTSVPMGQEVSVTAMQMCRAFSTFANGGYLVSPTIRMRDLSNPDDLPRFKRILNAPTAAHTREVLRRVVTDGTGRKADSPMYDIFGKTGTAQIAGPHGGYIPNAFVASFVCGAPLDDPRIVVVCAIHHPNRSKGHFGGTVAAPAARRLIEQSLVYMGIPPHPPEETESTSQVASETASHD